MKTQIVVIAYLASAVIATSAALPSQHSRAFPLRYECDVSPALAGWTLVPGSTVVAGQASNSWLSFTTSLPQISVYRNTNWNLASNQAYTAEIRFRTPRRGQLRLDVDDGEYFRNTLIISSTGLWWNVSGVATFLSANTSNAMHIVRVAGWSDLGLRMVQVWKDGVSVYGPAVSWNTSSLAGATTAWGDPSATEECEIEIDYLRMTIGFAFEPFAPKLNIGISPGLATLDYSMALRALYQLQVAPDLISNAWFNAGQKIAATTTHSGFISESASQPERYYRVQEIVDGAFNQPWSPGIAPPVCVDLPAFQCTVNCLVLATFDPRLGVGYEDYPINGETATNQYRSFARREVIDAVKYAAARVECQAGHWPFGNNRPLGLGDMSEANGNIPGTSVGSPSHPAGTHVNGKDIDIAYYQLDTTNSHLRAICESRIAGVDQFHCVAPPNILDVWRTAFFVGILLQHPRLRVIGVDGQVGPLLVQTIDQLILAGWLPSNVATTASTKLRYETSDTGQGWYLFHHEYMHVSFLD